MQSQRGSLASGKIYRLWWTWTMCPQATCGNLARTREAARAVHQHGCTGHCSRLGFATGGNTLKCPRQCCTLWRYTFTHTSLRLCRSFSCGTFSTSFSAGFPATSEGRTGFGNCCWPDWTWEKGRAMMILRDKGAENSGVQTFRKQPPQRRTIAREIHSPH